MLVRGGAALPSVDGPRPYVRIGIRDEQKILGIGETTPWPAESAGFVTRMADAIGRALPELSRVDLDEMVPLEAVTRALAPVEHLLAPFQTARFAVETALLDAIGQRLGTTLAACLTSFPGHDDVPCNALLDAATDDLVARAGELSAQGCTAIKVKLRARDAAGFAQEVQALRDMQAVWKGELRLDPNGAWSVGEARKNLETLAELAPRYVEQPVPADRLLDLGRTASPWAADESLLVSGLPERLVEQGICAAFVLKPALLGGFSRSLELATLARSAGIVAVTTHALDGPVGIAAACEFARALEGKRVACGLDRHGGLSHYPALRLPHHVRAGVVTRPVAPGLGFSEEERKRWLAMA